MQVVKKKICISLLFYLLDCCHHTSDRFYYIFTVLKALTKNLTSFFHLHLLPFTFPGLLKGLCFV